MPGETVVFCLVLFLNKTEKRKFFSKQMEVQSSG